MRNKFVNSLISVANFLRLLDENGLLSLTNLSVIVLLGKICLSTVINPAEVAALLTVVGSYHFKRYQKDKPKPEVVKPNSELLKILDELRTDVGRLKMAGAFKNVSSS